MNKILLLILLAVVPAFAQHKETYNSPQRLYNEVVALDKAVFDAFNNCDIETFKSYFTEDCEFYHDRGGITFTNDKVAESVEKNICGLQGVKVRREVVPESIEVYRMDNYGAIIIGEHLFYQTVNGVEKLTGKAKFTHLCQYKENMWKITRVLSYDHRDAN